MLKPLNDLVAARLQASSRPKKRKTSIRVSRKPKARARPNSAAGCDSDKQCDESTPLNLGSSGENTARQKQQACTGQSPGRGRISKPTRWSSVVVGDDVA